MGKQIFVNAKGRAPIPNAEIILATAVVVTFLVFHVLVNFSVSKLRWLIFRVCIKHLCTRVRQPGFVCARAVTRFRRFSIGLTATHLLWSKLRSENYPCFIGLCGHRFRWLRYLPPPVTSKRVPMCKRHQCKHCIAACDYLMTLLTYFQSASVGTR